MTDDDHLTVTIQVLGGFEVKGPDGSVVDISGIKPKALIAILALSPGMSESREKLATLLWSDRADEQARGSLRQAMASLKRDLGSVGDILDVERDRISLNRHCVSIDAIRFQELTTVGKALEALDLYRGQLLQGLSVSDQSFEDWLSRERQQINELAIDVHETSIKELAGRDRIKLARQLLELDPLREASHRILIEALAAAGERDLALRQYEACSDMLQRELGVKPEPRSTELFDRIAQTGEGRPADKQNNETGAPKSSAEQTSLAVLPFTNLSGNPDQDFFAAGITEDLLAELARYRHVKVVGHRTFGAVSSPPSDLAEFGRHHGLDFVIEGRVRWSTNRVRVSVRLVDSHSGAHVWADHFDRELDDILTVQDEIVGAVVSRLTFNLEGAAGDQRQRDPTTSGTAYTWFLRGRAASRDGEEKKALQLIEKAAEVDPDYARAHAYAAWFYAYGAFSQATGLGIEETDRQARAGIERALSLDRSDPFVLHRASMVYLLLGEPVTGLRYAEAAARQNPRDAEILVVHGFCLVCCGEAQRGVGMLEKAIALEPYAPPSFYATLSDCRYFVGDYAGSLQALDQILNETSAEQVARVPPLAKLGRLSEAKAIIDEALPGFDIKRFAGCFQRICARPEDAEHWLEGFRLAGIDV
ncbi:MAG: BTAD domain-containing putative transcriptional regulator [Anderseniella sp.]|nr:BTAD domain-containing putative transcriptional regulator [Anderseniella sp.]